MERRLPHRRSALRALAHATPGVDDDLQGKASADIDYIGGKHLALTSPQTITRLQRTIGNQATIRLLRRDSDSAAPLQRQPITPVPASRPRIQRWALRSNNPIDWTQTQQIRTLTTGQTVFFFDDTGGDTIVVKGEDTPVGLAQLTGFLHWSISGTPTVVTRDATSDKATVINLLSDPNKTSDQSWTDFGNTNLVQKNKFTGTPAEQARQHQIQRVRKLSKLHAMTVAPGKTIGKLSTQAGVSPGDKSARWLFDNADYLYKLGMITAMDLFLENGDRVWGGNFGNWFTDVNGAITLIDSIDTSTKAIFSMARPMDSDMLIRKLAKGELKQTANDMVSRILQGLTRSGDQTATEWLNQPKKGGTRADWMAGELLKGLKEGKARIIRRFATHKMSKKGRMAKAAATVTHSRDTRLGDKPQTAYWDALKARARWLNNN